MDEVIVVVDGLELAEWSATNGESLDSLLQNLRALGVSGVGVHEWTLQDAAQRGEVFIVSKATLKAMDSPLWQRLPPDTPDSAVIVGWSDGIDPWLARVLADELPHVAEPVQGPDRAGRGIKPGNERDTAPGTNPEANPETPPGPNPGGNLWILTRSNPASIVLGLNPAEVEAVQGAGLLVIPRLQGGGHESLDRLARRFEAIRGDGLGPVVFKGTSVPGFPGYLLPVAEALKASNSSIALIEFAPQHGFPVLAKELGYHVIRAHSITDREMAAGMAPGRAVDRWLRAVRERQIRLLYVRLYMDAGAQDPSTLTATNLSYLDQLTSALRQAGYHLVQGQGNGAALLGSAPGSHVFSPPAPVSPQTITSPATLVTVALIALAAGACAGWVAWAFLSRVLGPGFAVFGARIDRLAWPIVGGVSLLTLAVGGALWLKGYTVLARQGLALLTAIAFPVASVWTALGLVEGRRGVAGASTGGVFDEGGPVRAAPAAPVAAAVDELPRTPSGPAKSRFEMGRSKERAQGHVHGSVDGVVSGLALGIMPAIKAFVVALAITLVGASFVATLMSDVRFLLKIEEFRGVKLAHLAPLVILGIMLIAPSVAGSGTTSSDAGAGGFGGASRETASLKTRVETGGTGTLRALASLVRAWMNQPIRLWELLVVLGAGLVVWVYLIRTGNQGLPVPALEEAFRRLLEENLYARPRTKELLIGHPAIVAALACWVPYAQSKVRWRRFAAYALMLAGAVGQISILNTFAHAHSALAVSLARTVYGVVFGLVLGVVAVFVLSWLDRGMEGKLSRRGGDTDADMT